MYFDFYFVDGINKIIIHKNKIFSKYPSYIEFYNQSFYFDLRYNKEKYLKKNYKGYLKIYFYFVQFFQSFVI